MQQRRWRCRHQRTRSQWRRRWRRAATQQAHERRPRIVSALFNHHCFALGIITMLTVDTARLLLSTSSRHLARRLSACPRTGPGYQRAHSANESRARRTCCNVSVYEMKNKTLKYRCDSRIQRDIQCLDHGWDMSGSEFATKFGEL